MIIASMAAPHAVAQAAAQAPAAPAAPAAPRAQGPLSQAEVREIAREIAAGQREGEAAAAQVREAEAMAQEQVAADRAREAAEAAREGVPAPGTTIIRKDGRTIVLGPDGAPAPGEAIAVAAGPNTAQAIAEKAQETIGMVGGMALGGLFIWLFFRTIQKWLDVRRAPAAFPRETADRLARIENAIEAMAVEVERISEGQRFTTRLLSEKSPVERAG